MVSGSKIFQRSTTYCRGSLKTRETLIQSVFGHFRSLRPTRISLLGPEKGGVRVLKAAQSWDVFRFALDPSPEFRGPLGPRMWL